MKGNLSDHLLSKLSEFIVSKIGLHFPKERWGDLERGIGTAAREFGFNDAETCIQRLLSSPWTKTQIEILASHLTIGETYFFRERKSFEVLEERISQESIHSRREGDKRLRIWSAGCATGEEPYSIAILLNKIISDLKDWNITILATDINPHFLKKAAQGTYTEWSFRDTPKWVKEGYFKKSKDGHFEILTRIKKMVTFSYLNFAEDTYPSLLNNTNAMDIIFCRNVLMYFAPGLAQKVIQNLYRSLVEGGWLIVSPSETSHILFSQFATVNFPGVILYKKEGSGIRILGSVPRDQVSKIGDQVPGIEDQPAKVTNLTPDPSCQPPDPRPPIPDPRDAGALYEQGHYAEAAEKMLGWVPHYQNDAKALSLLARAYANLGRLKESVEWCENAIHTERLNPGLYYLYATILQEQGMVGEAMISLKKGVYIDPNFVLAHFAMGNLTFQQGKLKESKKHFENALSLLKAYRQEDILPESEGITVGRLMEIISSQLSRIRDRRIADPRSPVPVPQER